MVELGKEVRAPCITSRSLSEETMGDHKCFSKSNHTAGCILGGALRPLWKGKEEEGTELGLGFSLQI